MGVILILVGCAAAAAALWFLIILGIILWHLRPLGWAVLIATLLILTLRL